MASYHINYDMAPILGNISPITYILYQYMRLVYQRHSLQSSSWMAHYRMTGHISIDHEPKSSGLSGGAVG